MQDPLCCSSSSSPPPTPGSSQEHPLHSGTHLPPLSPSPSPSCRASPLPCLLYQWHCGCPRQCYPLAWQRSAQGWPPLCLLLCCCGLWHPHPTRGCCGCCWTPASASGGCSPAPACAPPCAASSASPEPPRPRRSSAAYPQRPASLVGYPRPGGPVAYLRPVGPVAYLRPTSPGVCPRLMSHVVCLGPGVTHRLLPVPLKCALLPLLRPPHPAERPPVWWAPPAQSLLVWRLLSFSCLPPTSCCRRSCLCLCCSHPLSRWLPYPYPYPCPYPYPYPSQAQGRGPGVLLPRCLPATVPPSGRQATSLGLLPGLPRRLPLSFLCHSPQESEALPRLTLCQARGLGSGQRQGLGPRGS